MSLYLFFMRIYEMLINDKKVDCHRYRVREPTMINE